MVEHPPEKATGREVVEKIVEGGLGLIPVVGSPLAMAFGYAMGWAHDKRMKGWLEDLAGAVDELADRVDTSLEDLVHDDVFVDAVIHATRAAQATHQEDKRRALRNAVVNSIGPDAPELDEQTRFFRLVDELTPSHLTLLRFLDDPAGTIAAAGLEQRQLLSGSRSTILEELPGFRGRREWYDLLAADLDARHLAQPNLHTMMTGSGVWNACTTALGRRFLLFLSAPEPEGPEAA